MSENFNKSEEKKTFEDLRENIKIFEQKTGFIFDVFFLEYYPKLTYYINSICKDMQMAEDFAVDTFLMGLEKINLYDETHSSKFGTWLFKVGRNITIGELKSKKNNTISMDSGISNTKDTSVTIKAFLHNSQIEDEEERTHKSITDLKYKVAINNIDKLNQPFKKVIQMRELQNLSYKEIASRLGSNVKFEIVTNSDSKIKLPKSLSDVTNIIDVMSGDKISNYSLSDGGNLNPFYTHITLPKSGKYIIEAREPYNLSTIKNRIRKGRQILEKMSKSDFNEILMNHGEF